MQKKWNICQPDADRVKRLSAHLGCHPITAVILINRKLTSADEASLFLTTSLNQIRPPFDLKDMDTAVDRICRAIQDGEKMLIFGDYDVDGISATAVLFEFLQAAGADVTTYIPHRILEGYSLQPHHIENVALPNRIQLILTADCGSGSTSALTAAAAKGIDVVVTDHHEISKNIPPAVAVLNPKRLDCSAGMEALAGVGVAFALVIALRKQLRHQRFWKDRSQPNLKRFCDLVALGTIGDMVPLVDENRIFAKTGLNLINAAKRPGINALLAVAGISQQPVNAEDITFRLVPRLNAAGRMDHASHALQLLMTQDTSEANQLAQTLDELNRQRRELEQSILNAILADLKHRHDLSATRSLVRWNPGWHLGVLGIVASRLVDIYYRPVVLIAVQNQVGKGSARSIPGLDLHAALKECRHLLEDFGGHSMAAGLTIRMENLVDFQRVFEQVISQMVHPDDPVQKLTIDTEISFDDISANLMDEIETISPFGIQNPEPLFMARNIKVLSSKIVGQNHRKMTLSQTDSRSAKPINAICFNAAKNLLSATFFERLAFRLRWNRWNGKQSIQLIVEDAQ
ncbi:MAG: single-stranded-DNA-specific exonuclease RecJ [Deltaproteobacteria bacterium]|jgi:single-stranded-DNA-specific exonuclease|nr:single-stranded-DNA-specific exonuclease RecJ [Deltaproteobacteria bacterium]